MKATVFAPVNVALIKYWGKESGELRLPANSSVSVCLTNLGTTTTVEWDKNLTHDEASLASASASESGRADERMIKQLDRVRKLARISLKARVETSNNFPNGAGLSSSASGLAALTLAAISAAGLNLSEKDLSRLARLGSGSACRSIPGGWVEWNKGNDETSYAKTIFPADYWDLRVLVVILSEEKKAISSTAGQVKASTSPYYLTRIKLIPAKIKKIKIAIRAKDFTQMGKIMEEDSLNMHQVMQTQVPPLNYLLSETKMVMQAVKKWREEGLDSYFTINTGQNVLVFCEPKNENKLAEKLRKIEGVIEVRKDRIGGGVRII